MNSFTSAVLHEAGGVGGELLSMPNLDLEIGHVGEEIYVTVNGVRTVVETTAAIVDIVASEALSSLEIAGGSLFLKRALNDVSADNIVGLSSSLAIASDYETYLRNQDVIDSAISASFDQLSEEDQQFYTDNQALFDAVQFRDIEPLTQAEIAWFGENASANSVAGQRHARITSILDQINSVSAFAQGWIISLQRAAELGLDRSAASDFFGGAQGFVDSLSGLVSSPISYEDIAFRLDGDDLEIVRDANFDGVAGASEELLFDETGFLRHSGHADGGVGYNQVAPGEDFTNGNDILIGASGEVDAQIIVQNPAPPPNPGDPNPGDPNPVPGSGPFIPGGGEIPLQEGEVFDPVASVDISVICLLYTSDAADE